MTTIPSGSSSSKQPKFRVALTLAQLDLLRSLVAEFKSTCLRADTVSIQQDIETGKVYALLDETISKVTIGQKAPDTNYIASELRKRAEAINAETLGLEESSIALGKFIHKVEPTDADFEAAMKELGG